jgi:hypothetical protein
VLNESYGVPWKRGMFNEKAILLKITNNPDSDESVQLKKILAIYYE